ncbi:MMPL family transporter [Priestia megaterium]|uniref:MMPL family transporter n=1 Tax=Priestia megaterium TaxID=1404 RepID=UPI002DB8BCBA|nr:MMPL family transporter [Priestia megaterium]MEC1072077.1 MMPL family transporter [Priestia megaterium]
MKKLINWRSLSFVLWIVITVALLTTMPNLEQLVKEKGQITLPKTAQSSIADEMIKEMDEGNSETYEIIAVFNSGNEKELTNEQKEQIESVLKELEAEKNQLGITEIKSHLDSEEMEKQLISKDSTTILTQISIDTKQGDISEVTTELKDVIKPKEVKTYLTGSELIVDDFENSIQEGVKKTEVIAVIFIFIVLIIVFRSPIVPIISLLTVGISYLVSLGVIAQIVDKFNFPFSNFTQVFVVVVLMGIGTDYNILLYTRFKEELSKKEDVILAVKATFKSAGKTVLYSGLAVLIGFVSLIFANFKLYQAMSGVAIGVAVLLLVLITLNPFFMALLGKRMFYPVKKFEGHGDSRLWGLLTKNSVARPIIALIFVSISSIPFILSYSNALNFNDLFEVNDKYESKQGINVIEDHFPPGFSSPGTLVIQSDNKLDVTSSLQTLDELTEIISEVEGVLGVYSPTRPAGEKIKELYINEQTNEVKEGLGEANSGIGEINKGLSSANDEMKNSDSNELANVQRLIDGTKEVENGVLALGDAMNQLTEGINSGASGAKEIEDGLASLNSNIDTLTSATSELYTGYNQLETGLSSYEQYFENISQGIDGAKVGYQQTESLMNSLIETKPELTNDPNVQQTLGIAISAQEQLNELSNQLNELIVQHQTTMALFREANGSLAKVNEGLGQLKNGVDQLQEGTTSLKNGLVEGTASSDQIVSKTQDLQSGVAQINDGQVQLLNGLNDLQEKIGELQDGLTESTEGLDQVSDGLGGAQQYLNDLSESKSSEKFYIPQEALERVDIQEALKMYLSDDRKIAKMTIILDVNPYSREAMPIINDINKQVDAALNGTDLEDAKVAIAGTTARNADLKDVSQQDFKRTTTIMLIGIALVLMVITRSVSNSVFIVGSLVLVFFTSLGIGELISSHILNVDILSWNVPFFSFIMIVALGVDYSIFLMMRYNELEGDPATRIGEASRHIGGVVLSAALILGGTFAALIPSGVLTLIQLASVVIVGLLLLALIAMPILLPALMVLANKLNNLSKK